jgi:hypothetical protein
MKKTFKKVLANILVINGLSVGLMACTETNDVINPGQKPVVEAYLAPGQPVVVKLTKEIPYTSENAEGKAEPINGLTIRVTSSTGQVFVLKSLGEGQYSSASTERVASAGTIYQMEFEYLGRKVSARTEIPPRPKGFKLDRSDVYRTKIDLSGGGFPNFRGGSDDNTAINATWQNPDQLYHFVAAEIKTTNPTRVITLPSGFDPPRFRFTNSPTTGTSNALPPPSFEYFGTYQVVLYRVGIEYADLYRSGGTSTQNLSTPSTSITNGLGIFTGVNADTLQLVVRPK